MTDDQRHEVVEVLEAFQAANVELRRNLRQTEVRVGRILRAVKRGDALVTTLEREDLRRIRTELVDELSRFEAAKHRMRLVSFRAVIAEGATVAQVARVWGFSRQLASRFAKEALGSVSGEELTNVG